MSQWKIVPGVNLYFVTTTVVDWQFVFTSITYFEILIESLRFCVEKKGLRLHGYVIMPNHTHYILSTENEKNLSDIMRDFNRYTSRRILEVLQNDRKSSLLEVFRRAAQETGRGNDYKLWQDGFHPIAIVSEEFFIQKLEYLHDNPVRKGYVEKPEHWRYSSARNYILGDHSIIAVDCLL